MVFPIGTTFLWGGATLTVQFPWSTVGNGNYYKFDDYMQNFINENSPAPANGGHINDFSGLAFKFEFARQLTNKEKRKLYTDLQEDFHCWVSLNL